MTPKTMLEALVKTGLSQSQIAEKAETSQVTVCRILKGSDPRYTTGKKIEVLYQKLSEDQAF
jgi:predicted transcriptional regulator